tara:strand:- start:404 stop:1030 length:627 start_codon:yes stop_codon:yes gene_type:complete
MSIGKPQGQQQRQAPVSSGGKNDQLGLMLYALGGALKGDKNFVQNTMQLQKMQEGKKKQEEKKKNYQDFLSTLDPDSPFYNLTKSMGYENLDNLLLERYKAENKTPPKLTKSDYVVEILGKMKSDSDYVITPTDQRILDTVANTDPLKIMVRDVQNQMSGGITTPVSTVTPPNTPTNGPVTITSQAEFDALPVGSQYTYNGQTAIKGK